MRIKAEVSVKMCNQLLGILLTAVFSQFPLKQGTQPAGNNDKCP